MGLLSKLGKEAAEAYWAVPENWARLHDPKLSYLEQVIGAPNEREMLKLRIGQIVRDRGPVSALQEGYAPNMLLQQMRARLRELG